MYSLLIKDAQVSGVWEEETMCFTLVQIDWIPQYYFKFVSMKMKCMENRREWLVN